MNENDLKKLLESYREGRLDLDTLIDKIKQLPYSDLGYAKVDHHRQIRVGYPEVIYCPGKTLGQIRGIVENMLKRNANVLATRATREMYEEVRKLHKHTEYHEEARIIRIIRTRPEPSEHYIAVVTAGTSDFAVAEEAAVTAETFGNRVERIYDVGVAGIHRLMDKIDLIRNARVVVVVAGMEGALASVVGGLVDKPVIAVPTSIGYGASFQGLSALLGMLTSCASGVTVVNIDNGFGAGYTASIINRLK